MVDRVITTIQFRANLKTGHEIISTLFPLMKDMPVMAYFDIKQAEEFCDKTDNQLHHPDYAETVNLITCFKEDKIVHFKMTLGEIEVSAAYLNIKIIDGGPDRDDSVKVEKLMELNEDTKLWWMVDQLDKSYDSFRSLTASKLLIELMYHEIEVDPHHVSFLDKNN